MPTLSLCARCLVIIALGSTLAYGQNSLTVLPQAPTTEPSVYTTRLNQPPVAQGYAQPAVQPVPRSLPPVAPMPRIQPPSAVEPAIFDSGYATSDPDSVRQAAAIDSQRKLERSANSNRLADRRVVAPNENGKSSSSLLGGGLSRISSLGSMSTTIAALALVVGLFLLVMALVRRTAPRSSASLPADVAGVLGRVPMPGRQSAYLMRLGNKLLLVAVTPNSTETLSEVTDPAEVNRLLQQCHHFGPAAVHDSYQPTSFAPRRVYRDA